MDRDYLIELYHTAVAERDALNEGTMTTEETAGYWLHEASHNPNGEYRRMLDDLDIKRYDDPFCDEVLILLDNDI